jgi:hypothetical protein
LIPKGLLLASSPDRQAGKLFSGVESTTQNGRVFAVAVAAAHDLNDELTVIINSLSESMEYLRPGHPAWDYLGEIQGAAQRCIWKVAGLLNYTALKGTRPHSIALERLIAAEPVD